MDGTQHASVATAASIIAIDSWEALGLRMVTLADVKPRPVAWLWKRRVPLGMLTMLGGHPEDGKSLITIDVAARVTQGLPMPAEVATSESGDVIFIATEDDTGAVIRARCEAAGADMQRVHVIEAQRGDDGEEVAVELSAKFVDRLEMAVQALGVRLVVIDPFTNYLPADADLYVDSDVRRVLKPVAAMAARTGTAVLVTRHLTKTGGADNRAGAGSMGITGIARSELRTKRVEREEWRTLSSVKLNLAARPEPLQYRVVGDEGAGSLEWRVESADSTGQDPAAEPQRTESADAVVERRCRRAVELARDRGHVTNDALSAVLTEEGDPVSTSTAGRVIRYAKGRGLLDAKPKRPATITLGGVAYLASSSSSTPLGIPH